MVRLARILSGVLCGVFTIGVIANLIAMTQGNRIGATGFGLAGLAAYYSYRGLQADSDERSVRTAWFTSVGFAVLVGSIAIFVLKLAVNDQALMPRGLIFAAVAACFVLIAVGVRQWREELETIRAAALAKAESDRRILDLARQVRFATGETLLDRVRGVPPPAPPAPTEPAATRPALYVSRTGLPVPLSHPARSYFGGLPKLPPTLAWPERETHDGGSIADSFVAQIDLEEVAAHLRSELPERGTLYFFFPGGADYATEDSARVLYYEQRADTLPMRSPPDSLERYGYGAEPWPWLDKSDAAARVVFKFPLSFTPFTSVCDYEGIGHDEAAARIDAELRTKVSCCDPSTPPRRTAFGAASTAWPFNWASIAHASRAVMHAVDDLHRYKLKDKPAETIEQFASIRARAATWLEHVADKDPLSLCDLETRERFREDWNALNNDLVNLARESGVYLPDPRSMLRDALILACCLAASDEDEDKRRTVPPEFRAALENDALWNIRTLRNSSQPHSERHQLLGFGLSVQSGPADHADDELVLQIKGDRILGWFPTVGCVLQFWIDRESLAARDFNAVQATMDCD